jgi:hypothetical protein
MFYIVSMNFLSDPLYFDFNSGELNSFFFVFLSFRNLSNIKRIQFFWYIIFSSKHARWGKRSHHTVPLPGRMVGPISFLVVPFVSFFGSMA